MSHRMHTITHRTNRNLREIPVQLFYELRSSSTRFNLQQADEYLNPETSDK